MRPTDRLTLQTGIGYLHGKYLRYIDNGVDAANNRAFTHSPKWTLSSSVDWTALEADWGKLNLIADLNLVSKSYVMPSPLVTTAPTHRNAQPWAMSRRKPPQI